MELEKEQRSKFEAYCQEHYFGESGVSAPRSKTVTKAKAESIVNVLKGINKSSTPEYYKFANWVKRRGFQLISHQLLGLNDVLCLPAKQKV